MIFAIILYWIHCNAFDAEYNVNIARTIHRREYTRKSPERRRHHVTIGHLFQE